MARQTVAWVDVRNVQIRLFRGELLVVQQDSNLGLLGRTIVQVSSPLSPEGRRHRHKCRFYLVFIYFCQVLCAYRKKPNFKAQPCAFADGYDKNANCTKNMFLLPFPCLGFRTARSEMTGQQVLQ